MVPIAHRGLRHLGELLHIVRCESAEDDHADDGDELIQRAGFIAAFITWLISIAALATIILLISAGFDAFKSGREQTKKSKMYQQELEQFIGDRK